METRFMHYDRWGNPIGDLTDVQKAVRTTSTTDIEKLEITVLKDANVVRDERILMVDKMGVWNEYIVLNPKTERTESSKPYMTLVCYSSIAELSRQIIYDRRGRGVNATIAMTTALDNTRWEVGTIDATESTDIAFYHSTVLEALDDISETFGLEIKARFSVDAHGVVRRFVDAVQSIGRDTARTFHYSRDLKGVKRSDPIPVYTRLYGFGKGIEILNDEGEFNGGYSRKVTFADINGGRAYIENDEAREKYGLPGPNGEKIHSESVVEFPEVEDPHILFMLTTAALAEAVKPKVSYEASVISLAEGGLNADGISVGDYVYIEDETFNPTLKIEGRIQEIEEDIVKGASSTRVKLGNIIQSLTDRNRENQNNLNNLINNSTAWDSAASLGSSYVTDIINGLNSIMNVTGGFTYLEPGVGLTVYNRPIDDNPTQAIQLGGGYFRIASSRNSDGTWNWRTFGTGEGFVADEIIAGTLRGGNTYFSLETGVIQMTGEMNNLPFTLTISPTTGFQIYSGTTFVGGMEVVGTSMYVRAVRVGSSSTNYITTGRTTDGYYGSSFMSSAAEYLSTIAYSTGVAMRTHGYSFLDVSRTSQYVRLSPPLLTGLLDNPTTMLYLSATYMMLRVSTTRYFTFYQNGGWRIYDNTAGSIYSTSSDITINNASSSYIRVASGTTTFNNSAFAISKTSGGTNYLCASGKVPYIRSITSSGGNISWTTAYMQFYNGMCVSTGV